MPIPISLNDLVDWASSDFTRSYGSDVPVALDSTDHFYPELIDGELREVAVSVGVEAILDLSLIHI